MAFSSSPKSRNPGQNSSDVEISTIPMVPLNDGSSLAAHVALYACISGKTGSPHMQAECTAESDLSTEDNWIEHTTDIIYTIVEFYLRTISETFPVARYRKALINPRCVKLFYTSRILEREVHHPRLRGIQMMRWEQHASRTIKFPHYIVIAFRGHYYRVQIPIHVHHRDDKQRPHHTFEIQREELLSLIRHIVSGELDMKEKHFVDESVLKEPIDVPSQTSDTTKPTSSSAPKRLPTAPPPPTTAPAISPVTPARNMFPHLYTPSRDIRSYSVLTNLPDAELVQWIERLNSEQLNKHILKAFRECMFVIALDPEKMEADPSNCRIHSDPSEVARRVSRSLNLGHWWLEKSLNLTLYADGALLFRADSALNEDVALQSLVQYVQVKLRLRSEDKKCLVGTGRSSPEGWDASAKETHVPNVMIRSDDGTVTQPSGGTQNKTSTMPTSGVKQTVDLTVSRRSSLANAEAQAAKSATDAKKTTVVNHASSSSAVGPSVIRLPIWLRGAHFSEMEEMVRSATDKRSSHPVWHWMQCRVSGSLSSRTLIALHLPVSPMVCLVVLIAVHQIKWPCVSKHSSPVLKEIITKRVSSQLIHTDDAVPSSEIATGHATRMALIGGAATQRLVSLFSCEEKHMIRVPVMAQAIIDACAEITDLREKCTQDLSSGQKVDFTPDPANLLEYQVLVRAVDELPVLGETSDARAPALSSAIPFYSPAMNTLHVCYAQRCSDNIEWLLTTGLRVENSDTEKKRMEELVCEMNRVSNEMVGFIRYDRHVKYGEALSGRKNASK